MYHYYYKKLGPLMAIQLFNYFMINIVNMYLVRKMGYSMYGDYSLALIILFVSTTICAFGATFLMVKELPKLIHEKKKQQQYIFLKWDLFVILRSFLVITTLVIFSILMQYYFKEIPSCLFFQCTKYRHVLRDVFYSLPIVLLIIWNTAFLISHQHSIRSRLLSFANINYVIALIFIIADLFLIPIEHTLILTAIITACLFLLAMQYITIFLLIRKNKQYSYKELVFTSVPKKDQLHYKHSAFGMLYNQILYIAIAAITITMLEITHQHEAVVGHYTASLYIASIFTAFTTASAIILQPWLSAAFDKERIKKLQSLIYLNQITGTIYYFITLTLFFSFKNMIYEAYHLDYPHMTLTIFFMLTIFFIFSNFSFSEKLCIYNNMNRKLLIITAIEITLLIIGAYIMIPYWSILGALFATAVGRTFATIASFFLWRQSQSSIKTMIIC